jgi:hypothetical protein
MIKPLVGALALAALPSVLAFSNTSPFFLFSTGALKLAPNAEASVAEASRVTADVIEALKDCPTKSYVVVEQWGVSAADFADGRSAPRLSQYMAGKDGHVKTTFAVPDVVGHVDRDAVVAHLKSKCGHQAGSNVYAAPGPNRLQRESGLQSAGMYDYYTNAPDLTIADETMDSLILKETDLTVIYITTPIDERVAKAQLHEENPPYEMENVFGSYPQLELKRDLSSHVKRANSTNSAGLFERYQYFTPGIFMAFSAIIPLFLILLVGVRALTSLEVSYFAFSKEMGPNAQKK